MFTSVGESMCYEDEWGLKKPEDKREQCSAVLSTGLSPGPGISSPFEVYLSLL